MKIQLFLTILIALNGINVIKCDFPPATMVYMNHKVLMQPDIYQLYWNTNDDNITFEVHIKNSNENGWGAFGLSPNGGMNNADICVFWVSSNGGIRFDDRHIDQNGYVYVDDEQNWSLLSLKKNNNYLIAKFTRPIKICDPKMQDRDITDSINHVIYSFGTLTNGDISYHQTNRGSKALKLVGNLNENIQLDMNQIETETFIVNVIKTKNS
jgi:hypothetical protein